MTSVYSIGGRVAALLLVAVLATVVGEFQFGSLAVWREHTDSVQRAVILANPTLTMPKGGIVVGWHVFTARGRRSQSVTLQVWRPVNPVRREYYLAGQTVFSARWIGHNFIPLFPQDRIVAKPNDVLGLYFPKFNPVPWDALTCRNGNEHLYKYNPKHMAINKTFSFEIGSSDWNPCRIYAFNATLMTAQEVAQFDSSNATFPPVNNRGLHGQNAPSRTPYFNHAPALCGISHYLLVHIVIILNLFS